MTRTQVKWTHKLIRELDEAKKHYMAVVEMVGAKKAREYFEFMVSVQSGKRPPPPPYEGGGKRPVPPAFC